VALRRGSAGLTGRDRAFVDTGAWFAYVNAADPDHARVRTVLQDHEGRLVTSSYIFDETITLTRARLGHGRAMRVGGVLLDPATVEMLDVGPSDFNVAWALFQQRSDTGYSFTDCTSFVLMRREGLRTAVALDEHFSREGFTVRPTRSG
jgi:hypothetical protein